MANYKKVDADQLDADLKSVADSIRSRAETEDALVFPDGFVSAVEGIPDLLTERLLGTITEYRNETIEQLGATAFGSCTALVSLHIPAVKRIETYCFQNCFGLTNVTLESCTYLNSGAFIGCSNLVKVDCHAVQEIRGNVFNGDSKLTAVIIRTTTGVCTLAATSSFGGTPIESGTGYIYFYRSEVDKHKSATNWSVYASQIRAIEDYPEITGG